MLSNVTAVFQVKGWVKRRTPHGSPQGAFEPMASHNGVFVIRVISGRLLAIVGQAGGGLRQKSSVWTLNFPFQRAFAERGEQLPASLILPSSLNDRDAFLQIAPLLDC